MVFGDSVWIKCNEMHSFMDIGHKRSFFEKSDVSLAGCFVGIL